METDIVVMMIDLTNIEMNNEIEIPTMVYHIIIDTLILIHTHKLQTKNAIPNIHELFIDNQTDGVHALEIKNELLLGIV